MLETLYKSVNIHYNNMVLSLLSPLKTLLVIFCADKHRELTWNNINLHKHYMIFLYCHVFIIPRCLFYVSIFGHLYSDPLINLCKQYILYINTIVTVIMFCLS